MLQGGEGLAVPVLIRMMIEGFCDEEIERRLLLSG
jgi:hypothetical protein